MHGAKAVHFRIHLLQSAKGTFVSQMPPRLSPGLSRAIRIERVACAASSSSTRFGVLNACSPHIGACVLRTLA